jgi:hypothetical protein
MDLSYRAATSSEFYDLALSLIAVGQSYPNVPPQHLFKKVTRNTFKSLRKKAAEKKRNETLKDLAGLSVSLSFDSSKLGRKHILLSYISHPTLLHPTFFRLDPSPKTQKDYVRCLRNLLVDLHEKAASVGAVCVDGLPVQVNALSSTYCGLVQVACNSFSFSFSFFFH